MKKSTKHLPRESLGDSYNSEGKCHDTEIFENLPVEDHPAPSY